MKQKINAILGWIIGVIAPIIGLYLFLENNPEFKLTDNFDPARYKELILQVGMVTMLIDSAIFFIILNFNKERLAQGVLAGMMSFFVGLLLYRFFL